MKKKLLLTILLTLSIGAILATKVQANYQSIPTSTRASATAKTWITGIRQMEKSGQVMGLTETINTTNALATSEANNIDVHMAKNTEYGTALLLGASDYGKQGSSIEARRMDKGATTISGTDVKATTTGNVTGIYEMGYYNMNTSYTMWEWTAGSISSFFSSIAPRYWNIYTTSRSSAKVGDATEETSKWHKSYGADWCDSTYPCIQRGYNGTFAYSANNEYNGGKLYARAAIVSGVGL